MNPEEIANMLAAVGSGMYAGVMLCIGLGLGRYWLRLEPQDFVEWFTPNFWFLLPTVMASAPFALGGAIWSLSLARGTDTINLWWTVLALILLTFVVTLAYHLPINIQLWSGKLDDATIRRKLIGWLWMHLLRFFPALIAAGIAFV
ncbi:MAG: anthrone oxygenase family protein, partial [Chloroflexota bacterium]